MAAEIPPRQVEAEADSEPAASRTADGVATLRAMHQLLDAKPPILDDPVSVALIGRARVDAIRANADRASVPAVAGLRSHIVLRSRYAEDRLAAAVSRGVSQAVALGAGLDTFAYRQPAWAAGLRVFEVDHRASQRMKRDRLAAAGVVVPGNVVFVAVDLDAEPLGPGLAAAGFDAGSPAFVSCLGVLAYLAPATVDRVFDWVASLSRGSEFVFTIAQPAAGPERGTAARAAELDEPWRTRLDPETVVARLTDLGFESVTFLEPAEAAAYFAGRSDSLRPPRRISIARAVL